MARKTALEAARTREAILDAGLAVFAERGFAAAQLEDIASRASVTRGALYHHFEDKTALYLAALAERWDTVMAPVFAALEGARSPRHRLTAFVAAFLRTVDTHPHARALMKMSLSGDLALPSFAAHLGSKLATFATWRTAIARVLREAGREPAARERAQALLASLLGYSLLGALDPAPPDAATRDQCTRAFVHGALAL
jgi:TetR/AcrR family transcriptional regulator, acrAB operon repressor